MELTVEVKAAMAEEAVTSMATPVEVDTEEVVVVVTVVELEVTACLTLVPACKSRIGVRFKIASATLRS